MREKQHSPPVAPASFVPMFKRYLEQLETVTFVSTLTSICERIQALTWVAILPCLQ